MLDATALDGRRVLVTGAGGSLGGEIARACARARPRALLLLDRCERGLVELLRALDAERVAVTPVLGDVGDPRLLASLFVAGVDVVFHAAAVKHVPFLETQLLEALRVNALASARLVAAARDGGARRLVLLSTDKAVEPASVLGASKRVAELLVLAADPAPLACVALRLCNVRGSAGSALPLFDAQIAAGGPLTLTDPDATRYWLPPDRAVALALAAGARGEPGALLVPDPGAPRTVLAVARERLAAAGREVPIAVVGLRPGEKRAESLVSAQEALEPSAIPGLRRVKSPPVDPRALSAALAGLEACVGRGDRAGAFAQLRALVPDWTPSAAVEAHVASGGP